MIEQIPITDRESWLALRRSDVTASVVASLFGAHPYETALGLYAEKTGLEMPPIDNAVLRRGRLLECAVAVATEEDRPGWKLRKATDYFRDTEARIGATPDFFVDGDPRGLGIVQAKTVAPATFRKAWGDGSPPFWIALQAATEMMLTGATWGAVAALVVDPYRMDCQIYEIPRHAGVEARIREAVTKFWADVAAGREPDPDYGKDADLIAAMYPQAEPAKTIDLSGDNMLPVILAERAELKSRVSVDEARIKEIETEIKFKMADAEIGMIDGFRISFKNQHRKAYSVAANDFRALRITDQRAKEDIDHAGAF
jgi:predicted phage-related endonuclease